LATPVHPLRHNAPVRSFLLILLFGAASGSTWAADPVPAKPAPAAKPAPKPLAKPAPPKAAQDPYTAVQKPATPDALLRNVRFALEQHLLVTERFYEDQTLQRYFGGSRTLWFRLPRPILKNGKLQDFGAVFAQDSAAATRGMDIMYKLVKQGAGEKRRALIGMELGNDPRNTVDAVLEVFGRTGQVADPGQNPDVARPRTNTPGNHPLGNKLVTYEFDGPRSRGLANFLVNGDGSLASFMLVEEDKAYGIAPMTAYPEQGTKAR
jgi:hypothetical protein